MEEMSQPQRKIAVFDDDPTFRSSLVSTFEKSNFKVYVYNSPNEISLDDLANLHPDVITLDVMMPGKTGFELATELKENQRTKNIPFVFITSRGSAEEQALGSKLGSVAYFIKYETPIADIVQSINQLLR
jgi:DNA-binding response OmpR family regulator